MVHIYKGILLTNKVDKIESFVVTWMELDCQSDVNRKEKNEYLSTYTWNLEQWHR